MRAKVRTVATVGLVAAQLVIATSAKAAEHFIPLFISASNDLQQGFLRVINHSDRAGSVSILGIDDAGREFGPFDVELEPYQKVHFNSDDLEMGNASKGISPGIGGGQGDWRLRLDSALDIEVLAYVRTVDGFLTSIHDVVRDEGLKYRFPIFNPGSNRNQQSLVRLINPNEEDVEVSIAAVDDKGEFGAGQVTLTLTGGEARTVSAQDLEFGATGLAGQLGDGAGKWELFVSAEDRILAMNLLQSPTGNLTNLSTTPTSRRFFREVAESAVRPPDGDGPVNFVGLHGPTGGVTSEDGLFWRSVDDPDLRDRRFYDVAYGNGLWVAVGNGLIATSPDGREWTRVVDDEGLVGLRPSESTAYFLKSVAFGNRRWVAVGRNAILSSTDGENWIAVCGTDTTFCGDSDKETPDTGNIFNTEWSGSIRDVEYGNGLWIALAPSRTNAGFQSRDGVDWEPLQDDTSGCSASIARLAFDGGLWIGWSDGQSGSTSCTRTDDGEWNTLISTNGYSGYKYGNDVWVIRGSYLTSGGIGTWRVGADRWQEVHFPDPPAIMMFEPESFGARTPPSYAISFGQGRFIASTPVGFYFNGGDPQESSDWTWAAQTTSGLQLIETVPAYVELEDIVTLGVAKIAFKGSR